MTPEHGLRQKREIHRSGGVDFVVEIPSELTVIEAAVGYLVSRCRAFQFEGPKLDLNFRVGITEALANAVLYGNESDPGKTVRIEVSLNNEQVEVWVIDEGPGFNPDDVPDPTRPECIHSTGGRGLFLMRRLMDTLEYNERGNGLRMVLTRSAISKSRR